MIRSLVPSLVLLGVATAVAVAQPAEPDPDAAALFRRVRAAYAEAPVVHLRVRQAVIVEQDGVRSAPVESEAEIVAVRGRGGAFAMNGWRCVFDGDRFVATHEERDDAYFVRTFDGSPYWTLLDVFRDLPFPHLALLWGEAADADAWMQLNWKTPMLVPRRIVAEEGRTRLVLAEENGTLDLVLDPGTLRLVEAWHALSGGEFTQPGAIVRTTWKDEALPIDDPDALLAIDVAGRRKVDSPHTLAPQRRAPTPAPAPPPAPVGIAVGDPAPALDLTLLDGGAFDLAQQRGKVVVIDFWATWCGPCRRTLPQLHELAQWAERERLPVVVVTVNTMESRDGGEARRRAVGDFWAGSGFTLPVALDLDDAAGRAWGVDGIPATFVVGPDGRIAAQHTGAFEGWLEVMKDAVRKAAEL